MLPTSRSLSACLARHRVLSARWLARSRAPWHARERGITLIELIVFIVVVAVGLSGVLAVFIPATAASADPMPRRQALAIAESLLEEVSLMPFTWCDPDDANVANALSAADCASLVQGIGPNPGETRFGPTAFDNVGDYAGYAMTGIVDITNAAVVGSVGLCRAHRCGGHRARQHHRRLGRCAAHHRHGHRTRRQHHRARRRSHEAGSPCSVLNIVADAPAALASRWWRW